MLMAMKECGWPAWFAMLLGVFGFFVAAGAILASALRVRAAKVLAFVALTLALFPALVGIVGTALMKQKVEAVLSSGLVDPSQEARIRAIGDEEASQCTVIGGGASTLPIVLSMTAIGLAFVMKPKAA